MPGSSQLNGSRQMLQQSSYESSRRSGEEDGGAEMGFGLREEEEAKDAIFEQCGGRERGAEGLRRVILMEEKGGMV